MLKIAICGKANSGKNTLSKLLFQELVEQTDSWQTVEYIAFADPIKEMARLMFPKLPRKYLFGSSKYRSEIVPGAFKDGQPLTIRQLLIDLGTGVGRAYNETTWLDTFDHTFKKAEKSNKDLIVVTDVRFKNEFEHLKKMEFKLIRLVRDTVSKINHSTETNQDFIKDEEFDFVVENNGSLKELENKVSIIMGELLHK